MGLYGKKICADNVIMYVLEVNKWNVNNVNLEYQRILGLKCLLDIVDIAQGVFRYHERSTTPNLL